jgi:multimeric flavodoxin WrbA/putative sterol carrier protein
MSNPTRAQQIFLYLAPFPALAFYKVWSAAGLETGRLLIATLAMLGYGACIIGLAYHWDKPSYFDWTVTAYFGVASLALALWPQTAGRIFTDYATATIYAGFFAAAFFPPLLGMDPFTYHYAKKSTPKEAWGNPIFFRINIIMTYVWAGIFAVCVVLSLDPSLVTRAFLPLGLMLGFGLPFNLRFPDYYLKRLGLPSLAEQRRMAQQKPAEARALSPLPLPMNAWQAVSRMPEAFDTAAAGNLSALIGFIVSGSETFEAYLRIEDGVCTLEEQVPTKPDLLIRTPADVWLAISRRERDGQEAFMQQAFTAEGDLGILMRMNRMFGGSVVAEPEAAGVSSHESPPRQRESPQENPLINHRTTRKENIMKVLALNSSPRREGESKTALMLTHLVQGMSEAGADVEVIELRNKTVKNCIGCFTCWTKTPGVCIHNDDMTNELFPKWRDSDIVVYASPLYVYTLNASMKAFTDRIIPILEPFLEERDGRTFHPWRQKPPAAVVLSVAGFPEDSVFDQLSSYVNFLFGKGLLAEIYRPAAETMTSRPFRDKLDDILAATVEAGRQLVASRTVSPETLARIRQPIVDFDTLARIGNAVWKTCIAERVTPRELHEKGMIPRPDSIETFMDILTMGFNPKRAGNTKATLQFRFSGEAEGSCYLAVENGTIQARSGTAEKPDLTIEAPFGVWMDIMTGKADGQQMFMQQKYRAVGDLSLLMRMSQLFGR